MSKNTSKKIYEVPKRALLIIAGIIWMIAGFNVVRLGILSYRLIEIAWYLPVFSVIIFALFGLMFYKMTQKHSKRIMSYEEVYRPFWNFFDVKSYIIMAVMMGGGIGLRNAGVFPDIFVAFFYTGLGCALFLAGVRFIIVFFKNIKSA
ncbi:MAG: hypothetical protein MJ105_04845 [Lachnospiraceae bacterium]|nr:hypothetical protein [Lachnospiraceae bacterium]